jgi:hypothetical protein
MNRLFPLAVATALVATGCSLRSCERSTTQEAPPAIEVTSAPPTASAVPPEPARTVIYTSHWGYVDQKGSWAIEPQFGTADRFQNGLALVSGADWPSGEVAYIDRRGKVTGPRKRLHEVQFPEASGRSEEGYISCNDDEPICGFYDHHDRLQFEGPYYFPDAFHGGLAAFEDPKDQSCPKPIGIIDKKGRIVRKPQFSHVGTFSEGLIPVCMAEGSTWPDCSECCRPMRKTCGFLDRNGKVVVPIARSEQRVLRLHSFHEGLVAMWDQSKAAWGFQNRKGEWVIPPRFEEVEDFSEGLAAASIAVPFPR